MSVFYSEAQFDMLEEVKAKGEVRYATNHFTGKAFRTAEVLRRDGLVKVQWGMEQGKHGKKGIAKMFIVVTLTDKGRKN